MDKSKIIPLFAWREISTADYLKQPQTQWVMSNTSSLSNYEKPMFAVFWGIESISFYEVDFSLQVVEIEKLPINEVFQPIFNHNQFFIQNIFFLTANSFVVVAVEFPKNTGSQQRAAKRQKSVAAIYDINAKQWTEKKQMVFDNIPTSVTGGVSVLNQNAIITQPERGILHFFENSKLSKKKVRSIALKTTVQRIADFEDMDVLEEALDLCVQYFNGTLLSPYFPDIKDKETEIQSNFFSFFSIIF